MCVGVFLAAKLLGLCPHEFSRWSPRSPPRAVVNPGLPPQTLAACAINSDLARDLQGTFNMQITLGTPDFFGQLLELHGNPRLRSDPQINIFG